MKKPDFEWDEAKDRGNRAKHGVAFADAQRAFFDARRVSPRTSVTAKRSRDISVSAWWTAG